MRGVEQFTRETKLVKRVNEWENRIVPILEEQDKHEEFDLHKNDMEYVTPEFDDHKNDMAYVTPEFDLHKNDMEYVTTE